MTRVLSQLTNKKFFRRLFAVGVMLVWLAQFVPVHIAAKAFEESCQLACCKSAARHSAGSCAGGKCHFQPVKSKQSEEVLCGAKELIAKKIEANRFSIFAVNQNAPEGVLIVDETVNHEPHNSDGSPLATKFAPQNHCQTDCCTASVSAGQQNRTTAERAVLTAFADKPRPPSPVEIEFFIFFATVTYIISRQTQSRAPPIFFS